MRRRHLLLGYVALVVTAPVVTWWLVPDMSAEGGTDHIVEPPGIPDAMRPAVGLGASTVLLTAAALVFSPAGHILRRPADARTVIPLVLAGAYLGFTYRTATAAVIGANIGGAMFIMAGMILVPALVLYAASTAAVTAWRRNRTATAGETTSPIVDWRIVLPLGVGSVVTMPFTAIWFLLLALLTLVATAIAGAIARSRHRAEHIAHTGMSVGLGLLPGPVVYLAIATLV